MIVLTVLLYLVGDVDRDLLLFALVLDVDSVFFYIKQGKKIIICFNCFKNKKELLARLKIISLGSHIKFKIQIKFFQTNAVTFFSKLSIKYRSKVR